MMVALNSEIGIKWPFLVLSFAGARAHEKACLPIQLDDGHHAGIYLYHVVFLICHASIALTKIS